MQPFATDMQPWFIDLAEIGTIDMNTKPYGSCLHIRAKGFPLWNPKRYARFLASLRLPIAQHGISAWSEFQLHRLQSLVFKQ
jgi:hypothetical protein